MRWITRKTVKRYKIIVIKSDVDDTKPGSYVWLQEVMNAILARIVLHSRSDRSGREGNRKMLCLAPQLCGYV